MFITTFTSCFGTDYMHHKVNALN